MAEKIRITLDLSPEFHARLERLEVTTGADSKAQLLREALKLYGYVVEKAGEGARFFVRPMIGPDEAIVFLGSTILP